ncbi:unnamed protein product [Amoebophrya sp. A25]|nr:unnamed protein product [Amoebophrya sp. A25]|eukprot:GSA25T00011472001.1
MLQYQGDVVNLWGPGGETEKPRGTSIFGIDSQTLWNLLPAGFNRDSAQGDRDDDLSTTDYDTDEDEDVDVNSLSGPALLDLAMAQEQKTKRRQEEKRKRKQGSARARKSDRGERDQERRDDGQSLPSRLFSSFFGYGATSSSGSVGQAEHHDHDPPLGHRRQNYFSGYYDFSEHRRSQSKLLEQQSRPSPPVVNRRSHYEIALDKHHEANKKAAKNAPEQKGFLASLLSAAGGQHDDENRLNSKDTNIPNGDAPISLHPHHPDHEDFKNYQPDDLEHLPPTVRDSLRQLPEDVQGTILEMRADARHVRNYDVRLVQLLRRMHAEDEEAPHHLRVLCGEDEDPDHRGDFSISRKHGKTFHDVAGSSSTTMCSNTKKKSRHQRLKERNKPPRPGTLQRWEREHAHREAARHEARHDGFHSLMDELKNMTWSGTVAAATAAVELPARCLFGHGSPFSSASLEKDSTSTSTEDTASHTRDDRGLETERFADADHPLHHPRRTRPAAPLIAEMEKEMSAWRSKDDEFHIDNIAQKWAVDNAAARMGTGTKLEIDIVQLGQYEKSAAHMPAVHLGQHGLSIQALGVISPRSRGGSIRGRGPSATQEQRKRPAPGWSRSPRRDFSPQRDFYQPNHDEQNIAISNAQKVVAHRSRPLARPVEDVAPAPLPNVHECSALSSQYEISIYSTSNAGSSPTLASSPAITNAWPPSRGEYGSKGVVNPAELAHVLEEVSSNQHQEEDPNIYAANGYGYR